MNSPPIPRTIRMGDTDAGGRVYTAAYFRLAHEAFELHLDRIGYPLTRFLDPSAPAIPVVHAEADFRRSLCVGDTLHIELRLRQRGARSFEVCCRFLSLAEQAVAETRMVHASVSRETGQAVPLPDDFLDHLTCP